MRYGEKENCKVVYFVTNCNRGFLLWLKNKSGYPKPTVAGQDGLTNVFGTHLNIERWPGG